MALSIPPVTIMFVDTAIATKKVGKPIKDVECLASMNVLDPSMIKLELKMCGPSKSDGKESQAVVWGLGTKVTHLLTPYKYFMLAFTLNTLTNFRYNMIPSITIQAKATRYK